MSERLEATSVQEELKAYLVKAAAARGRHVTDIGPDAPLMEAGILDSLSLLDFVLFIEKRYGIEVPGEEIEPEDFGSLAGVTAYLCRRFGLRVSG